MDNYSASFADLQEYTSQLPNQQHQGHELMKPPPLRQMTVMGEAHQDDDSTSNNNNNNNSNVMSMEHFLLHNHNNNQSSSSSPSGLDKLMSFADVMQFADFGPKLALNHHYDKAAASSSSMAEDPVYFLKFPVLNDRINNNIDEQQQQQQQQQQQLMLMSSSSSAAPPQMIRFDDYVATGDEGDGANATTTTTTTNTKNTPATASEVQLQFLGEINNQQAAGSTSVPEGATVAAAKNNNNKRKRAPRSIKTSEEVESQRMTHIAVERNRRKQMNEHLRVLRSLMPGSYVQRGDQASIIGGAIEFVRELEQLLQCLESQKRRRLYGEAATARQVGVGVVDTSNISIHDHQVGVQQQPVFFPAGDQTLLLQNGDGDGDGDGGDEAAALVNLESGGLVLREEMAENKSCLADIEVKLLGFDAMIKVLSRRRPGQLIQAIAALQDLQLNILHTNITTIEQTVLYSFNVKVESEGRFTAEEIASSVQQIFTFIHASSGGASSSSSLHVID